LARYLIGLCFVLYMRCVFFNEIVSRVFPVSLLDPFLACDIPEPITEVECPSMVVALSALISCSAFGLRLQLASYFGTTTNSPSRTIFDLVSASIAQDILAECNLVTDTSIFFKRKIRTLDSLPGKCCIFCFTMHGML
jgi:hypothetical protein